MVRRIESKESIYKREMADVEATRKELESVLIKKVNEHSQLFEEFRVLEEQYIKLEKENAESAQALNCKTQQLDAKQCELEELQNELAITDTQVSPV